MPRSSGYILKFTAMLIITVLLSTGCTHRTFAKPDGDVVGSCEGTMQFTSGGQSRFILKLYYSQDSEDDHFKLYFMLPGRTGYIPVEDLEFDEDTLQVVTGSKKQQVYEGIISKSPLKFKGSMKGFKGAFTLDLMQFMDK